MYHNTKWQNYVCLRLYNKFLEILFLSQYLRIFKEAPLLSLDWSTILQFLLPFTCRCLTFYLFICLFFILICRVYDQSLVFKNQNLKKVISKLSPDSFLSRLVQQVRPLRAQPVKRQVPPKRQIVNIAENWIAEY